jgi:hypothetical protein
MSILPRYDQLPVTTGAPAGSSWGLWGPNDRLGCLNKIDAAAVRRGLDSATSGEIFPLNLSLSEPSPPMFDRPAFTHDVSWLPNEVGHDDALSGWNTQSSSQWDGFRHIRHPVHGFYNGVADEDHGVAHWAQRGLVTRAILCDVGRYLEAQGRPLAYDRAATFSAADVLATLDQQGSTVEPGDILLVRTGWVEWYLRQDRAMREDLATNTRAPGIEPGRSTAELFWDLQVAAVAGDNPALEAYPADAVVGRERLFELIGEGRYEEFFVHFALLPLLGLPIGEFFQLGTLADACAKDRRYTSLMTSAPLNLPQGVASPPNALAIR